MASQRGLGKGLSALLGEESLSPSAISEIDIYEINPNPNQPRRIFSEEALNDLAENIKENGVISPIALRKSEKGYEIIAGERRWRAARAAGLKKIPAVVLEIDKKKAYQLSMVENLQREDLTPIEEARGLKKLLEDYDMTQEEVAKAISKSRSAVANTTRLLDLPQSVIQKIEMGSISAGHGRALLSLHTQKQMEKAGEDIILGGLSVRATENMVKRILQNEGSEVKESVSKKLEKIYIEQVERRLTTAVGRNISITNGKKKGKLYIEFYGNEDLEQLIDEIIRLKKD